MTERREIRSCQDLAWLAKQVGEYRIRHGTYPPGDIRSLAEFFQAKSLVIVNDQWGTSFQYEVTPDRQHYTLRSAGADRRFEELPTVIKHSLVNEDPKRDIVVDDGLFVQFPRVAIRVARPAAPN
jgi:hypothetical protein